MKGVSGSRLQEQINAALIEAFFAARGHPEEEQIRMMLEAGDWLTAEQLEQEQYAETPLPLLFALVRLQTLTDLAGGIGAFGLYWEEIKKGFNR